MNSLELKEYIVENNKQIGILEQLECHHIKEHSKYYTCARPNGKNNVGIQLYKQSLMVRIYTPDLKLSSRYKEDNADILTLIMILLDCSFVESNKWLHQQLGLKYTGFKQEKNEPKKKSPLDIFTRCTKKQHCNVSEELELIDSEILNDFIPNIHINWIRDGITPNIAEEFGIGYSEKKKRIIIPHRYWCGDKDDYVGIIGRTTIDDNLVELLGIPKYFPIKSYSKSLNIYGLNENYKTIIEAKYVCVFEAEKSVLKRASRLDRTATAVCCHSLAEYQVEILTSLNVEVVIAYDSDISEEYIWEECEKFYNSRNVSYIYDVYGLLKEKQSPADASEKIYQYLFNHRIKYDESMHIKYLEYKEEQKRK